MANERKTQIIKAAAKRFARHGLSKTTLDEVARDIRIGKATIYHYFTSKDDLYIQTLRWEIDLLLDDIRSLMNDENKLIDEKLTEYYITKNSIPDNYKLLFEALLNIFNERSLSEETEQIKYLLSKEEDLLKKTITKSYSEKVISISPVLPGYIVINSWGNLFGSKLSTVINSGKIQTFKEMVLQSVESILPK